MCMHRCVCVCTCMHVEVRGQLMEVVLPSTMWLHALVWASLAVCPILGKYFWITNIGLHIWKPVLDEVGEMYTKQAQNSSLTLVRA